MISRNAPTQKPSQTRRTNSTQKRDRVKTARNMETGTYITSILFLARITTLRRNSMRSSADPREETTRKPASQSAGRSTPGRKKRLKRIEMQKGRF